MMDMDVVKCIMFIIILILILFIAILLKERSPKGKIIWAKDKDGTNIWTFSFNKKESYETFEKDKYITFKIIKTDEIFEKPIPYDEGDRNDI